MVSFPNGHPRPERDYVTNVTKAFLRYLPRRKGLSFLQIVGIACGVAAVVGMVLSARSALFSFSRAIEFVNGRATHSLERIAGPLDERVVTRVLNDPSAVAFSPVIDRKIRLSNGDVVRVLGIDPFLDQRVRPQMFNNGGANKNRDSSSLLSFLLDDRACMIDARTAARLHLVRDGILSTSRGRYRVADVFPSPSPEPIMLVDIGHAQRLFNLEGRIDRIDLILTDEGTFAARFGKEFRIQSLQQKERMYTGMLEAFRLNLEALSLMGLFVGVFLVYNTTTFAVVSRRKDAGILRSLGAGRTEVAAAFLSEVLFLGVAGGLFGGVLGYLLSRLLTVLVGQSISNLYFHLAPEPLPWNWWILAISVFFGCSASLLGSIFPLLDLNRTDPVKALYGRTATGGRRPGVRKTALLGLVVLATSGGLFALSSIHVYIGFAAAFTFLFGISLLTGPLLIVVNPFLKRLFTVISGLPGWMAASNIRQNMSRTAVAIAAFMVALSMSIGLGSMIGSFRQSLIWWMGTQLRGDVYVGSTTEGFEVPEAFFDELARVPGLGGVDPYRNIQVPYGGKSISLAAVSSAVLQKYTQFGWVHGDNRNWNAVREGGVVVSESFSRNFKIREGDKVTLNGAEGPATFVVSGVFFDYTTEHGLIMMDRLIYLRIFGDHTINSVGVFIDRKESERDRLLIYVRQEAHRWGLPVHTLPELRDRILGVFDSTFAVTRSMRILAIVVAFFGIAGALLTLFMERQREFGIYRALGLSARQVALMTLMEGIGMGVVSYVGSLFVGTILSIVLIKVINLQSFNWTIFYYPALGPYLTAGATAVLASASAALYPIWKVLRTYPHMQLREE
jgi:putative ABC transport system permease protein